MHTIIFNHKLLPCETHIHNLFKTTIQLYTADGDRKHIFPIFLEDIDLNATEAGQGIKYVVSSVNWTMCRQGVDDYNMSISKLVNAMKLKGIIIPIVHTLLYRFLHLLRFGS